MKVKNVDFLIRYEHKLRELESIMLIRTELERRGYSVDFVGNYDYKRNYTYNPKVLVCPSLYSTKQIAWDLIEYGPQKKVANLLWEQVIKANVEDNPESANNVTGISARAVSFCWGEKSRNRIIKSGVSPNNAVLTGHINTDLLRGGFSKILIDKDSLAEKYGLNKDKRWSLFISSFVCCEMDDHQREMFNECWGIEGTSYFEKISIESRKQILDWFKKALLNYPEDIIIYRPHPIEVAKSKELWAMAAEFPNFKIISDEAIKHWINAADKVYNWYSTGMIDVVVLKKPTSLLRPLKIRKDIDYYIFENAIHVTSESEFLEDYRDLSNKSILEEDLFNQYYYIPQGFVYQKICDVLEEMYHTPKYDIHYTFGETVKYNYLHWRMLFLYPLRSLKRYLKLIPGFKSKFRSQSEFQAMLVSGYDKNIATEKEIEEIYKRIRPIIHGE